MLAWLYNLIIGQFCGHKWIKLARGEYVGDWGSGTIYHMQCKNCGKIKGMKI